MIVTQASCEMYITENIKLPPVLLIHSEYDPIVSVENSRLLYERLTAANHTVDYYEIADHDAHGGMAFYDCEILRIIQEFCERNAADDYRNVHQDGTIRSRIC